MNVLITIILLSVSLAQPRVDSDMPLCSESVATVDNIIAGFVNPAGLAPKYAMGFCYIHSFTDSTFKGDDGLMLTTRGSLISVQWLKHTTSLHPDESISRRKYLFASGRQMMPNFYWGLSYAWFGGSDIYSKKKIWKTGFMYRPDNRISLGLVVDDITRPKIGDVQLERYYTLGAAFFTAQRKLAFSIDAYYQEKDDFDQIEAMFRIELRKSGKFRLFGDYRTERMFRVGLGYLIDYVELGGCVKYQEKDYLGGSFFYNQGPMPGRR